MTDRSSEPIATLAAVPSVQAVSLAGSSDRPEGGDPHAQRLGALFDDRPCAGCGFNLAGQTIIRERHYGMLIVRCPECGTAAALQEYPLLGRWAGRWAMLLAGLWALTLFAAFVLSALAILLMYVSARDSLSTGFETHVTREWTTAFNDELSSRNIDQSNAAATSGFYASAEYRAFAQRYFSRSNLETLFRQAGGWKAVIAASDLSACIPISLLTFGIGAFWAVACPHLRLRGRLVIITLILGLNGLWVGFKPTVLSNYALWGGGYWGGGFLGQTSPRELLAPMLAGTLMALLSVFAILGTLLGRRLARFLLVLMLPPKLRAPLAFLWTSDGLRPPSARA